MIANAPTRTAITTPYFRRRTTFAVAVSLIAGLLGCGVPRNAHPANVATRLPKVVGKPADSWTLGDEIENDKFEHDGLLVTVVYKGGTIRQVQTALP